MVRGEGERGESVFLRVGFVVDRLFGFLYLEDTVSALYCYFYWMLLIEKHDSSCLYILC